MSMTKESDTLDLPKCVRCSCELFDDFQLIFDDTGLELELQKLLSICFDLDVKIRFNEIQALCDVCLNELIDTYDIIQRNEEDVEKNSNTRETDKKLIKTEFGENSFSGAESNYNVKENYLETVNDDLKIELVSDKTCLVDSRKRTQQSSSRGNLKETKKRKVDPKAVHIGEDEDCSDSDDDTKEQFIEKKENHKSTKIRAVSKIEDTKEAEDYVKNENDELLINEVNLMKYEIVRNSITGKDSEEEFHQIDYLDEYDEVIDIKEYKSKVLQSRFQDVCFPEPIKCRLCPKLLDNHIDLMTHTTEEHCVEGFVYPCVIDGECESLSSQQELSFHLVFKHYDLDALVIYCKCPECEQRFNNFPSYNKHCCYKQTKKDVSRTRVDCDQCGKAFTSNKRYRFHLQFHLEKRRPKACFICDKLFRDQDEFFEHVMYAHKKNIGYLCIRCDRSFTTAATYKNHENVHKLDRPYTCALCSKSYLHKHYLSDHMITNHGAESSFKCNICGKFFINKTALNNHLMLHNKGQPTEVICCNTCGFVAENEKDAENHLEEHKDNDVGTITEIIDKVYCCEYCEFAYNSVESLFEHRALHADKEYCCDLCSSTYEEYRELKYHKSTHPNYIDKRKTFPVARYYVCDIPECKKSYLQWIYLKAHKKHHQVAKTIKCPKCKQTFQELSEFQTHMEEIHKGSDYYCQFCDKCFASKLALGVHIARKHDTDQFPCDVCDYTYPNKELLDKHKSELHKDLKCPICGVVLKTLRNFQLHRRVVHEKEKRYFCQYCNRGFFKHYDVVAHEKAVHLKLKKFKCEICPYRAAYKETLNVHIMAHRNEKPYICKICKKGYRKNYSLKLHTKRHMNMRDFPCPYEGCEYAYVEKTALNAHIRKKHCEEQTGSPANKRQPGLTRSFFNVPKTDVFVDDDDGLDFASDEEELKKTSPKRETDSDESDSDDPGESTVKSQDTSPAVVVRKNFSDHDYMVIGNENKNIYGSIIEEGEFTE